MDLSKPRATFSSSFKQLPLTQVPYQRRARFRQTNSGWHCTSGQKQQHISGELHLNAAGIWGETKPMHSWPDGGPWFHMKAPPALSYADSVRSNRGQQTQQHSSSSSLNFNWPTSSILLILQRTIVADSWWSAANWQVRIDFEKLTFTWIKMPFAVEDEQQQQQQQQMALVSSNFDTDKQTSEQTNKQTNTRQW